MWLALDRASCGRGREQVLADLEAVAQFATELRERLGPEGLDGLAGLLGCARQMRAALDAVPAAALTHACAETARLRAELETMVESLAALRRLKGELAGRSLR